MPTPQEYHAYWKHLHQTALQGNYLDFLNHMRGLSRTFPCETCRKEISNYLARHPIPPTGDNLWLFRWSVDFHNNVNVRTGKRKISFDQALELYKEDCKSCKIEGLALVEASNKPATVPQTVQPVQQSVRPPSYNPYTSAMGTQRYYGQTGVLGLPLRPYNQRRRF